MTDYSINRTCNADNCAVPEHSSLNCWNKYVSLNAGEPGDVVESYRVWRSTRSADWGPDVTGLSSVAPRQDRWMPYTCRDCRELDRACGAHRGNHIYH